ncbi:MAG: zinc ribbon domain-containing protein [Terriglobia bacterium]|jgi:hypothetical protein|nr:zinc ribbon domain-containing protein [Terriglobia bacterium]
MSDGVRNITQEYWRPVQPPQTEIRSVAAETLCSNCGSEYAIGARFCHVCGNEREPETNLSTRSRFLDLIDFDQICERLGLSAIALVFTFVGLGCVIGAIMVGLIYTADTVLDWQAVQIWRIQWMLGALVAFAAAILLNKKRSA